MVALVLMMMVLNFSEGFKIAVQICLDGLTNDDDEIVLMMMMMSMMMRLMMMMMMQVKLVQTTSESCHL